MQFIPQGIPSGVILPFGGNTAPQGYLLCDGSTVSRSVYASLFNAISTLWGTGDGATTFHVPDGRGLFLRGKSAATGRDHNAAGRTAVNAGGSTGDNVGSYQSDCIQNFTGTVRGDAMADANYKQILVGSGAFVNQYTSSLVINAGGATQGGRVTQLAFDPPSAGARTSSESRPQNISVNYIIKT